MPHKILSSEELEDLNFTWRTVDQEIATDVVRNAWKRYRRISFCSFILFKLSSLAKRRKTFQTHFHLVELMY